MATVPPNTIIHLPPVHRRSTGEVSMLIFAGIVIPLGILWLLFRITTMPLSMPSTTEHPAAAAEKTPVVVQVVMEFPTVTPEDTPRPTWTPSPTAENNWCDARFTQPGDVCLKPFPPPPTPTPLLSCEDVTVDSGDLCRWTPPQPASDIDFWR
jgi:hypothetical protein